MTLAVPGSAQLVAGRRRLGHLAIRTWLSLVGLAVVAALIAVMWRDAALAVLTFGPTLRVAAVLLVVLGVGWALLFVDAWRLARPPELARRHRLGFALLNGTAVLLVLGGMVASASIVSAQHDLMSTVFAGGGDTAVQKGRYNILLMGGDAGKTRTGLRPDSLTVASVDAETGRTVLMSLPRNLEDAPFPVTSPLSRRFPRGFGCKDNSCMLNAVYTYATENRSLYPGVANPGAQATKEAVEGITGLTINYWVLIDLKGFRTLVDAVGGVTLDVGKRVPIGGGGSKVTGYIEPGKDQRLDGFQALWFARSRSDSSDYERMARQKCVMSAMLNQLDPVTVLANFNKLARAGKQVVATDIPTSDVDTLLDLALSARRLPVSSVAFVPPLVYPGSPNIAKIQAVVARKIDAAERADTPPAPAQPEAAPPSGTAPATKLTGRETQQNGKARRAKRAKRAKAAAGTTKDTENLGRVCRAV
jgi:LCP family protein required for cell wall assembly